MLIILGGLPGSGKTTIARELARQIGAVHVRIDSIEQAIRDSGALNQAVNDAGYRVGYAVAEDNLGIGRTVIADSESPCGYARCVGRSRKPRAGKRNRNRSDVFRCTRTSPASRNACTRYLRIEAPHLARGSLAGLPVMEPRAYGDRYRGPERRRERKVASRSAARQERLSDESIRKI